MQDSVEDVVSALRTFGLADYLVLVSMLLICVFVGVFFGFYNKQRTTQEYLLGGRNMRTFPVSMSLIVSIVSGLTLLGVPTEVYLYGTEYLFTVIVTILAGILAATAFLPVFHELQLTSTYEYLEKRFNRRVRFLGSALYVIFIMCWMPIVLYLPALAFNQVSGASIHVITPVVSVVCIFYTCVGGLKAVVWTDVIQAFFLLMSMVVLVVKGTIDVGGVEVVWARNLASGRIEAPSIADPLARHSFLSIIIGGTVLAVNNGYLLQGQTQRYLALPTVNSMRIAVAVFAAGMIVAKLMTGYVGMLAYATYQDCDPLTTKLARRKDQLLPLLVMHSLGQFPGLPGLFMAGIFSASLSSLSTALNSMAAIVLEDFWKTLVNQRPSERHSKYVIKGVVVLAGVCLLGLVFVVENLGTVLQLAMSLFSIGAGPTVGLFVMGMFLPWVTAVAALIGTVAGIVVVLWITFGTQAAIASGALTFATKPVSVQGCSYNFVQSMVDSGLNSTIRSSTTSDVFPLYKMSYHWYTLVSALVSVTVGLLISFSTGPNDVTSVDSKLLSPIVRRFFPRRERVDVDLKLLDNTKVREAESRHREEA